MSKCIYCGQRYAVQETLCQFCGAPLPEYDGPGTSINPGDTPLLYGLGWSDAIVTSTSDTIFIRQNPALPFGWRSP